MLRKSKRGFTLIELLVVIAIIGLLAAIVLVSLNTARQKARNSRRVSDLRQIALALEMYYDDNTAYPGDPDATACDDWAAMVPCLEGTGAAPCNVGYMTKVPTDPGGSVAYAYNTNLSDYVLRAQLEPGGSSSLLATDVDTTSPNLGCDCTDGSRYYCIQP